MSIELRQLDGSELDRFFETLAHAFGQGPPFPAEMEELWRSLLELKRTVSAWDGEQLVGTASTFDFRVTVPGGGSLPAAGVTAVGVRPTHRRRGVLRSMMRRQLDELHAWGEPLALLTASEPEIYGRFGYGVASEELTARIDTSRVRLTLPEGADELSLRLVDPRDPEVLARCEELYARRVPVRPGMLERRPGWQWVPLRDPAEKRDGASPMICVLAESDGELRGYARYAVRPRWDTGSPHGQVLLHNMEALDPAAHGALLRYLCDLDLTTELDVRSRPTDDPLLHMVSDTRRCHVRPLDQLHLRLVEVDAALAGRTYAAPVDVVFEVADAFCPWNEGRWRLTGDAHGARCVRTDETPELALSVRELASGYLGGTSLSALADAGLVRELRSGALAEATTAFRGALAPWAPHGF
ncbi:GNAT family N-acetyltransferase [Streptomyces oceani]|uniref:N-acetyltransferase domain-containing protein n=1 Tax=Streptomyces oceani TaxID=1075402 RepID=A0A1E7KG75_9ACTN|nr:GNAT family N-acetyltransferase [Streptomyces oceani]OEV02918.1 hypothetical protein AN216_14995 [Streptomyces oceani]